MKTKEIQAARRAAERAVSDMPDGPLKIKAFEVAFSKLLEGGVESPSAVTKPKQPPGATRAGASTTPPTTIAGRVLTLKEDDFFRTQRTLGETRDELGSRGWHHPLTTLSGVMQGLVRRRELRRQRMTAGKKTVWRYSNF